MAFKSNINSVIKELRAKLKPDGKKVKKALAAVRQEATTIFIQNVLQNTPAISGKLRGGWVASTGSPSQAIPIRVNRTTNLNAGQRGVIGRITDRNRVFVANNVPYARLVEFGGVRNVPRAMVRKALAATKQELEAKGFKVKVIRGR